MKVFWIDLFSGAGGTTTGIHLTGNAEVLACVNHDEKAIESHRANHPDCHHFIEDIRKLDVSKLKKLVDEVRAKYKDCIINLWASLECTNFSKAKGGLPRDADSRTLAYELYRYIDILEPTYIFIENVSEFMAWGDIDEKGKPISMTSGVHYMEWIDNICNRGNYNYDYRILNAADYGGYTIRKRYFGQFAKKDSKLSFPEPTHSKDPEKTQSMFNYTLDKWNPVKDVLDLEDEGESIFVPGRIRSEKTFERIYLGLDKFVANGEPQFIKRYNGGNPKEKSKSIDRPIGSISTSGRHALVSSDFLISYYGSGKNYRSVEKPSPTIPTKDRLAKVRYIMMSYSNGANVRSIESPAGTVVKNDKHNLITCKQFLMNPQFGNKGHSIERPCFTLIARMDKKPPYLISTEKGKIAIEVYTTDSPTVVKIKEFMAAYGIVDIKMRMLNVKELLKIQGFPEDYILLGTQTDQKKFIGNAVECNVAKALADCNYKTIQDVQN